MQSSFKVKLSKLKQLQDLVKQYNLRFISNPLIFKDTAMVNIDGDHVSMEQMNNFFKDWNSLNTDIREVARKTKFQKFTKKIKKFFS